MSPYSMNPAKKTSIYSGFSSQGGFPEGLWAIQPRFGMIRHYVLGPFRDLEVGPIDGEIVQKQGKRNRVE